MWIARATVSGWRMPLGLAYAVAPSMIQFILATNLLPEIFCIDHRLFFWGIPGALLLLAAIALEERFQNAFRGFPALLGNASYAIFLVHGFVLPFIGILFLKLHWQGLVLNYIVVSACVICSVIAGIVLHLWLELTLNQWLRGWVARKKSKI